MITISATLVKELRDATNAGMMECKRALVEAQGDKAKAITLLRERGIAIAQTKASRAANQGVIASALLEDGSAGSLIEINCETDFVAKNKKFKAFVQTLAERVAAKDMQLAEEAAGDITAAIAEIKENIVVGRTLRYSLQGTGRVASYIHHGATLGVLLELGCQKADTTTQAEFIELARDLCLHIAASNPAWLERGQVPADTVGAERAIYAKQVTGKPANIVEKIVDGKMNKFYEQICLLEQLFVKDPGKSVSKLLQEKGALWSDTISIRRFARLQIGEKKSDEN